MAGVQRVARAAGVAACVGVLGACGPPPLASTVTVEVEVAQERLDRVDRVVTLQVRNTGDRPITVTGARLTSAFARGTTSQGRDVDPGRMRGVRLPLGPSVCGPDVGDDLRVELDVTTPDGAAGTLTVVPTDETQDLARIHGEDCAAAAAAAGLRVSFDEVVVREVDGRRVADLVLGLEPVPGGPQVRVVSVRGTTLLRPTGTTDTFWTVDVDSAAPPADGRLVLQAVPARCDLHAIAEDKRGTVLGVETVVDGVEQPLFFVAARDALRGALHDYVVDACGVPTDART